MGKHPGAKINMIENDSEKYGDVIITSGHGQRGKGTFPRGIHPPVRKSFAADCPIEVFPTPKEVLVPLLQHLGAPCESVVKPRTLVKLGDEIGKAGGFVSSPVHASVSGKTKRQGFTTVPNGQHVPVIPITSDEEQPYEGDALFKKMFAGPWPKDGFEKYDRKEISDTVSRAGIVGLGGAAFPTHVKFAPDADHPCETLLINGAECEPYLTADYRLMLEAADSIVSGALIARHGLDANEVIICIEDNKPGAAKALAKAALGTDVKIRKLETKYPQGGEKQLILAVLGKEVPTGGLPIHTGVVVMNVGTVTALARAVVFDMPLTHRIVTISGAGIKDPKNLMVPIGTRYQDLVDYCGGMTDDVARIISGGPMMGFAVGTLEIPVTKGTSGITFLTKNDIRRLDDTACIRCGRCVEVCPMNLVPTRIAMAVRARKLDVAEEYFINSCIECGSCSYECAAKLQLVQIVRMGKVMLRNAQQK
jgi:H+/Na+-translocating ferredoxin:NAD+ oxidoreductase subunit C